jgi:hypothetical protein
MPERHDLNAVGVVSASERKDQRPCDERRYDHASGD